MVASTAPALPGDAPANERHRPEHTPLCALVEKHFPRLLERLDASDRRAPLTLPSFSTPVSSHAQEVHLRPSPTLLEDHDPAPTSRSRHAIARRRLSDRFAATAGRHCICAYSITFDS